MQLKAMNAEQVQLTASFDNRFTINNNNLGQFIKVMAGTERCLCTESYPLITVFSKPGTMETVIAANEW